MNQRLGGSNPKSSFAIGEDCVCAIKSDSIRLAETTRVRVRDMTKGPESTPGICQRRPNRPIRVFDHPVGIAMQIEVSNHTSSDEMGQPTLFGGPTPPALALIWIIGCNTDAGAGEGRKRTPSNWKAPIERDPTRRYPSAVCVIHSGPFGSIPSCTRHALCRYCVMRFSGSSASPFRAVNPKNKSEQHPKTARGILIAYVGRGTRARLQDQTLRCYLLVLCPGKLSGAIHRPRYRPTDFLRDRKERTWRRRGLQSLAPSPASGTVCANRPTSASQIALSGASAKFPVRPMQQ